MNNRPFVSIIIPFYNTPEKVFQRCFNSLINQTNGDFEAIFINDGSSQEYSQILNTTVQADKRMRLINKENEGSAIARNVGLREAKGEYIMFLDSDDAITDYCIEEAAQVIKDLHLDLLIGAAQRVTEEEIDSLKPSKNDDAKLIKINSDEMKDALITHMIGLTNKSFVLQNGYIGDGPWARILRRSIAIDCMFSEESFWSDDTIWNLKMLKKCETISIVDDLWYKYLIYSESKTRKFRPNCPYEFDYRTKQELELVKELWPNCFEGIYSRIFNDITILCRTFLFHPENSMTFLEKYNIYTECIHKDTYREALNGMNLKKENRVVFRIMKKVYYLTAYYGPNIVSYWILWAFYTMRKNAL